jgi:hypothetical protein
MKRMEGHRMDSSGSGQRLEAGKHGNEILGSMKCIEFYG